MINLMIELSSINVDDLLESLKKSRKVAADTSPNDTKQVVYVVTDTDTARMTFFDNEEAASDTVTANHIYREIEFTSLREFCAALNDLVLFG